MTTVNPVSQQQQQLDPLMQNEDESGVTGPKRKELSPDDFMTLFLTQMKHQNPMQPMDNSTMLQQMASISAIKTSKDMQKSLQELSRHVDITLGNSQVIGASQLIGKKVELLANQSHMVVSGDKGELKGSAILPSSATSVSVSITDKNGKVVKTIDLGPCPSAKGGLMDFTWDGKVATGRKNEDGTPKTNPDGTPETELLKDDFYNISASAVIDGKSVPLKTAGAFEVKSVAANPDNGKLIMNVDGLGGKYLNEIIKIM